MNCSYKKFGYAALVIVGALSSQGATAGDMGTPYSNRYVGTISVGPVWGNAGHAQTMYLTPEIVRTFVPSSGTKALENSEVFLGKLIPINNTYQAHVGVAVAATNSLKVNGIIWDDADPLFNNYSYEYKLQHTHIALKGKLLGEMGYFVMPWVSASLGIALNNSHSYNNTPLIFQAVKQPNFSSYSQKSLTYTLGAGVQKAFNKNWQVGVGYEFADWGKSQLGLATEQTLFNHLNSKHTYTNGLMFNLTYVA